MRLFGRQYPAGLVKLVIVVALIAIMVATAVLSTLDLGDDTSSGGDGGQGDPQEISEAVPEPDPEPPTPGEVAVGATQAFFDRDFEYLARHASPAWIDHLASEGYSGTPREMIAAAYKEEEQLLGSFRPPPEGEVGVLGEISYENWANQPWTTYKFKYNLYAEGPAGTTASEVSEVQEAGVILEDVGSAEATIPYRVVALGVEHPGSNAEGGQTALFGPYASMEFLGG